MHTNQMHTHFNLIYSVYCNLLSFKVNLFGLSNQNKNLLLNIECSLELNPQMHEKYKCAFTIKEP